MRMPGPNGQSQARTAIRIRVPAAVIIVMMMLIAAFQMKAPLGSADPDMQDNGDMTRSLLWNFTNPADYDLYNSTVSGGVGMLLASNQTAGENSTAQYLLGNGVNYDLLSVPDSIVLDNASLPIQTITLQPGPEGYDNYIDEWFPTWPPPEDSDLIINSEYDGTYGGSRRCHILMQLNLSAVPVGATIVDASLLLYQRTGRVTPVEYTINAVNASWPEYGVSWQSRDATHYWSKGGGDFSTESFSSGTIYDRLGWHTFDLTRLVDLWVRNVIPNYGFMVVPKPLAGVDASKTFFGSETSNRPDYRPIIIINYTVGDAIGVYESAPLGPGTNSTFTLASWSSAVFSKASDEFSESFLSTRWQWTLDPAVGGGSINFDSPGWLNVTGSQQTQLPNQTSSCNMLYQEVSGDFIAESSLRTSFSADSMGAGLMMMTDATTWLAVYLKGSSGSEQIVAETSNGGARTQLGSATWSGSSAVLRIERVGSDYSLLASTDGTNWLTIGAYDPQYDLKFVSSVGPFVFSGGSALNPWVEFDYVRIEPQTERTVLEISARAGNSTLLTDPSWGSWSAPLDPSTGVMIGSAGMYVQYRATLRTSDSWLSPAISGFECHYERFSSNGTITTREVAPGAFLSWDSIAVTQTLAEGDVEYLYSTDHGNSWISLGSGNSFALSIADPTLMLRAEITTWDTSVTPSIDTIELVYTISHAFFYVQAPAVVQAGELFSVYIEPKDTSNNTAAWTGAVTLHALDSWGMEGASSELMVTQADIPPGGQLTISDERYTVAETIRILVSGGGEVGISKNITVLPGPADNIAIEPYVTRLTENSSTVFYASVCDAFGNNISGSPITWLVDLGLGTLNRTTGDSVILTTVSVQSSGFLTASSGSLVETMFITVSPATQPPHVDPIPVQTVAEDFGSWTLDISPYIWDNDDNLTDLRWYTRNETLVTVTGENNTGYMLMTFTTILNAWGTNVIELWVVDPEMMSTKGTITIEVTPVNDPPKIEPIDQLVVRYDDPYQYNLEYYITDVDTPKDGLAVAVDPASTFYVQILNLWLTILYPRALNGTQQTISLSVTDGQYTASTVILVTVSDDQVPRSLGALPDQVMFQGDTRLGAFDLDDYFTDPDGTNLYFTNRNTHVIVLINANHTVDFLAPTNWAGEEYIIFTARDDRGARAESPLHMTVLSVNQPPVISNVPDLVVRHGVIYNFDLLPYIYDPDDDRDTLVVTVDDSHAVVIGSVVSILFPSSMNGMTVPMDINVSDGFLSASWTIQVTISDDNPPMLTMTVPDHSFLEDNPMDYPVIGGIEDYFTDLDADILTFSVFVSVANVTAELQSVMGDWSVNFSTDENWHGLASFTIRATDPQGALSETTVALTVVSVPDSPRLTLPYSFSVTQGTRSLLDVSKNLADPDSSVSDFRWTIDSSYSSYISIFGGTIIFDFPADFLDADEESRTISINVTVIDQDNLITSDGMTVTVQRNAVVEQQQSGLMLGIVALLGVVGVLLAYTVIRRKKPFVVRDMMLIHNDGFLISRLAHHTEHEIDEHILSGMLTAVLNFVEDSMATSGDSLKTFGFKEYHVLVSRGEKAFAAVVYEGDAPNDIEKPLKQFLGTIEMVYRKKLSNWTGDIDTDFAGVELLINAWVKENSKRRGKKKPQRSWVRESSIEGKEQAADEGSAK